MIFNHSVRIVKKISSNNISGLRLSKLSAQSFAQRCVVFNKDISTYDDISKIETLDTISIRKIGKSMEIKGNSFRDFFQFLAQVAFGDDSVVDFLDMIKQNFIFNENIYGKSKNQGLDLSIIKIEKEKDALILYLNLQAMDISELNSSYIGEDEIFPIFEEIAIKYNLGLIYDGFNNASPNITGDFE